MISVSTLLFEAEWLICGGQAQGDDQRDAGNVQWTTIGVEHGFRKGWERAWRKAGAEPSSKRLFKPQLLSRTDIRFIMAISDGACVGGGVLNAGAGLVGLTNLFADGIDLGVVWNGAASVARAAFPDQTLIAYDHGESLVSALSAGFTTIGRLCVWREIT